MFFIVLKVRWFLQTQNMVCNKVLNGGSIVRLLDTNTNMLDCVGSKYNYKICPILIIVH